MPRRETRTGGREATEAVVPGRFALSIGMPPMKPPHGFAWRKLTDIARMESGHTPSRARPEYWNGDVPWIGIKDATGNHGRQIDMTIQQISDLGVENSSARLLPAGTVCLSRTASVGYVVLMGTSMATSQDFINWVCGKEVSPQYLLYLLMAEQESIRKFAYGTTHQTLYYPDAKALHVCLPVRHQQDAVVEILGSLDSKIDINERLIASSDELASAVAKSRLTSETTTTLSSVASLTMGTSPPGASLNEEALGTPFFQGTRDFGVRHPRHRVHTTSSTRFAEVNDSLISVRAPVGEINIASERSSIGRGVAAAKSLVKTPHTLFHILRQAHSSWAPFNQEGTIFGSINRNELEALKVPTVRDGLALELEASLAPTEQMISAALRENDMLADLRNLILPNLISGRLQVKDAENQVEGVV